MAVNIRCPKSNCRYTTGDQDPVVAAAHVMQLPIKQEEVERERLKLTDLVFRQLVPEPIVKFLNLDGSHLKPQRMFRMTK